MIKQRYLIGAAVVAFISSASAQVQYDFEQLTEFGFGTAVRQISIASESADRIACLIGTQMYLYDRPSGTFTQVASTPFGPAGREPLITPDGSAIIFLSSYDHVGDGQGGQTELYEYDIATGTYSRLVNLSTGYIYDPRLSGDGRYVVFMTGHLATRVEVFRVDRTDGSIVVVSDTRSTSIGEKKPDISGDGRFIVYRDGSPTNITLWDAADGTWTNLTNNPGTRRTEAPRISDDGRFVCFYSSHPYDPSTDEYGLFLLDREDGSFSHIARPAMFSFPSAPFEVEMAPDGSAVFFESDRLGTLRDLYRYDTADGTIARVTTGTALFSDANLADDATRRYVSVARDGTLAYRSEQPDLDPNGDNSNNTIGANFDLFIGWPRQPCAADLTTTDAAPGDPLFGSPDGVADPADVAYFVTAWLADDAAIADLTAQNAPVGDPNYGVPDGLVTGADINFYVNLWVAGCP